MILCSRFSFPMYMLCKKHYRLLVYNGVSIDAPFLPVTSNQCKFILLSPLTVFWNLFPMLSDIKFKQALIFIAVQWRNSQLSQLFPSSASPPPILQLEWFFFQNKIIVYLTPLFKALWWPLTTYRRKSNLLDLVLRFAHTMLFIVLYTLLIGISLRLTLHLLYLQCTLSQFLLFLIVFIL